MFLARTPLRARRWDSIRRSDDVLLYAGDMEGLAFSGRLCSAGPARPILDANTRTPPGPAPRDVDRTHPWPKRTVSGRVAT
jgi:hypothetical protein